ncbi:hypothetical protein SAMN04487762_2001 [Polaribacter sp. Hel1_33_78]|uniref:hypothetical protein n=1 Tax=Polaribacter sp. Hel1_33_78 TaxID=1336804 RepID=UPI00087B1DF9|nr:hypothetical protein [Polaribacter sp. Hel1_33_78]SDU13380.1 hypothetical protein SAMN04487762_2001 [Polaribacter sp. Hel1_33_78]
MNKSNDKVTLELVLRQCVFIILNIYAISKLLGGQFYMKGKIPDEIANTTLGEASGFSLAWTFMGHSYFYILFIGVFQLSGAWFLLWNKTKLIGVLILIPIMVNIIVFDIIFLDVYPALANAIIVLLMLFLILFFNGEIIKDIVIKLTNFQSKTSVPIKKRLITFGITILFIILIFSFDSFIEYWLGASKEKIIE